MNRIHRIPCKLHNMRGIIGQCRLYQQYALRRCSVQYIYHNKNRNLWEQQSLQYSLFNKPLQSCLIKPLKLVQSELSICLRHKSKRSSIPSQEESEDDDFDSTVTLETGPDFKDLRCRVGSLRIGALAKVGFNMSRTQSEKEFYFHKFRVNAKKVEKKSATLKIGDIMDYIKENSVPASPDLVEVSRLELRDVGGFDNDSTDITVVIRRYPKLLILREDFE